MGCTSCLERSLQDSQRALTKARSMLLSMRTILKELRPHLPPEQQKQVDEALNERMP